MGYTVKILGQTEDTVKVGGYGIVYGGRDLEGETFTPQTDYRLDLVPTKPVFYDHAMNAKTDLAQLGNVTIEEPDDIGVWIEAELDKSNQYTGAVMKLVERGVIGWSSGSAGHLTRREGGIIKSWPVVEYSLTPTPAEPRTLGVERLKNMNLSGLDLDSENKQEKEIDMSDMQEKQAPAVDLGPVLEAIAGIGGQVKAFGERLAAIEATPDNDPGVATKGVNFVADTTHWKYDNLGLGDLALANEVLRSAGRKGLSRYGASDAMIKALGMRLESDDRKADEGYGEAYGVMKKFTNGIKANELNQSTLANYGDEWVGIAYGTAIWESIRLGTPILERQMRYAVPQPAGAETMVFPLEGADPTWYLVAQASALGSNPGGVPTNTVTASKLGTAKQDRTMAKLGARVLWTGELEEDSVVNYVAELRRQLAESGMEMLESLIIDGDTATGASANINDIAGTPAGSEYWLGINGYRKLALVTNTANARDGGALTEDDFLETVKLMGIAGKNAFQKERTAFISDLHTYWQALKLPTVKTRDVNSAATIENGDLTRMWGYDYLASKNMHAPSAGTGYELKAQIDGKIDQDTASDNTKGALLAVRFDQWRPGYRRQMTIETQRHPAADANEIVALLRFGMVYRDIEASAITYNLTV